MISFGKNGFFSDKDPENPTTSWVVLSATWFLFTYPDSMTSPHRQLPPIDTYELRPRDDGRIHIRNWWWDEKVWDLMQASTWLRRSRWQKLRMWWESMACQEWSGKRTRNENRPLYWLSLGRLPNLGVPCQKDIWFRENKIALLLTRVAFKELSSKLY